MRITKKQLQRIIRESLEDDPRMKRFNRPRKEPKPGELERVQAIYDKTRRDDPDFANEWMHPENEEREKARLARLREVYGNPIGSGDPAQEILDWAEEGNRVTVAGKNIWAGLGSRAGLHSYADEVVSDKWHKSGERFTKKIMNLPAGTEVELKRFQSSSRGRGNWVTAGTVTTQGPVTGSGAGGEIPKVRRMREIFQDLSMMYDRDIGKKHLKSISLYQGSDNPWVNDKVWEVQVGKDKMLFQDRTASEYAEWENGAWELYSPY